MQSENRNCQNCKKDFTIEADDFLFYEKVKVPPPTFCPDCRAQRRMSWRNERFLNKQTCGLCKKSIISIYKQESPFTVYCHACFRSDAWDPFSYGIDYDFTKTFFEQFNQLQKKVPRLYAMVTECYNSEYVNGAAYNKNCYLIFASDHDEDCAYSYTIFYCKDIFDCLGVRHSEFSAECIDCEKISKCFYSQDCLNSYNLYFCKNCAGCNDCVGCVNLRNKSFCIFNEQYTREEYEKKLSEMSLNNVSSIDNIINTINELHPKFPVKYYHGKNNLNSTGDYITHSKNCTSVFDGEDVENCKYLYIVNKVKDSYDSYAIVENVEGNLEVISNNSSFSKFCLSYWSGSYGTYSDTCENCTNCFGCIGLRNKQYCILNKQYTKEQYENLVSKIIQHMSDMPYVDSKGRIYKYGEFFPSELSPFAYNETIAQEYFPLTKEQSQEQGYKWKNKEIRNYNIDIYNKDIPESINDVNDSIVNKVIECAHKGNCNQQCTEVFKIIPEELLFYKRMNLPLPRLCSNCRHYERLDKRNPLKLWHRVCMKEGCNNEFETSYAPERPEIVYCERCYQNEVY
ncbi:MAG: hypothetical protein UR85_C0003G0009 [Candidatus Nomurabacteria bacterium GW2011_GWF2_35_66]|uniref:Uncharacterized protein n=1 Tax=Candidatus Nomurabacteria bacterium GW2011_GWE1_35_16 TaxID=1618761 RepID=A0A0G0B8P0_9BACT|nr:MAG: hypothetical protein UR55_C0005G0009 [Candidatus Nomurabacteria bacterium GW2011_GWF1_34_20]KKP63337.1 MAG: hypothetical protein UR57_C0005G0009 [Candidatus Nomurabacteria bacterium GW2011_GWE2_34_25]KKP65738.1 MAG: hypothetical protein UR64_C0019G0002 [Candidatus Nomurabacteria bacterium GW2011_GWE1_35_16]KKP83574.1 MAG: hypothetical protein UR85_C0003G0009 [Candidatus Nomurabacteria bacterium GW2011_GWF2_35_66]HAE36835.1 hypothetical protein [Candidatus Nomurabacteria bacterium]